MYPVKITGKLVMLRELTRADVPALYQVYGNSEATRHLSFTPRTVEQVDAIIAAAAADAAADPRAVYMLAVAHSETGELIGAGRLGLGEWDSAQIGFALRPDQWGHGCGTETVRLFQQLTFRELGLHRLWGARSVENEASARTMTAAGMTEEGVIRGHVRRNGVWSDSISHSILLEEYASR